MTLKEFTQCVERMFDRLRATSDDFCNRRIKTIEQVERLARIYRISLQD
jgi:hypothetical protein